MPCDCWNAFCLQGPWKKRNLADLGVVTQCIAPQRVNDQYLTNVLLKINAKVYFNSDVRNWVLYAFSFLKTSEFTCHSNEQLGGINSFLSVENSSSIPIISEKPTMIIGMDVSHGSPGQSDIPSVAAVSTFFLIKLSWSVHADYLVVFWRCRLWVQGSGHPSLGIVPPCGHNRQKSRWLIHFLI